MTNPLRSCYFTFDDAPTWRGITDDTRWNGALNIVHVDAATHAEIMAYFAPENCPANADNLLELVGQLRACGKPDGGADYSGQFTTSESTAPRYWARVFGLGYHPDTRGADYVDATGMHCLMNGEAARYDADHAAFDGDAYGEGMDEWEFLGLIPADEAAHHAAESAIMAAGTVDPAAAPTLFDEIARYNDQVNGMEVAPNGDDYNALLDIIRLYGEGRGDAARAIQPSKEEDR